jgi:glycosyltransferase involved in cell wall biosynthesis
MALARTTASASELDPRGLAVRPWGVHRRSAGGTGPPLSVVIPVYNEEKTLEELLRRVLSATYSKQVIVVDDGSTDGTAEVLGNWRGHPQVELLAHPVNRGKGAAIRTGLEHARGRFTIIQDADLEYDPADYPLVIGPLLGGAAEVVYGSRYLAGPGLVMELLGPRRRLLRLAVAALNLAVWVLYGVRLTDEATCYKGFPTDLLRSLDLRCERFEFCPEVTAKVCRLGLKILEVPIRYDARNIRAGKKLRWTDGLEALRTLWRFRHWCPPQSPATEAVAARRGVAGTVSHAKPR